MSHKPSANLWIITTRGVKDAEPQPQLIRSEKMKQQTGDIQGKIQDDVREALASEITRHVILATRDCVMIGSFTASKEFAECLMPDVKRFYNAHIQPIIEAAKTERDEYWKDKITTYITSDVRKVSNED